MKEASSDEEGGGSIDLLFLFFFPPSLFSIDYRVSNSNTAGSSSLSSSSCLAGLRGGVEQEGQNCHFTQSLEGHFGSDTFLFRF